MDLLAHLPKAIPITFNPYSKFEGHTSYVTGVAYLPGGQRIMTCSWDGSLRVWNLQTRKQIANDWGDGEDGVYLMRLSPDGKKVVSGDEGAVKLWDVDTGKLEVIVKCTGNNRHGVSVGWSGDSKRVVIGADDGTTRVWDVESGQTVLVIETGLSTMRAVIYSPDMTMIATGGYKRDEHLKIWDAKTGQLVTNIKGHQDSDIVLCLAWTADGKTLISATEVTIRTWNATTWQKIVTLSRHASVIKGIVISPNDRILASAAYDHTTILWNLENGQAIVILHHRDPVLCTSFSPDGKLLATGCRDNKAYIWDISAFIKDAGLGDLPSNPNVS
jgi:WD40 repeat protein